MNNLSSWAQFFNEHAPVYEQNCFTKNTLAEVGFLQETLNLPSGARVLDVGCGTGRHAIELARRGYQVTGFDISTGMLQQARQAAAAAGVTVRWCQGDATAFHFDETFDAVICLCEGSFGLLGRDDDALAQPLAILRNVAAALQSEGKCLFTVLNGYAMIRRHSAEDCAKNIFDPLSLTMITDCAPAVDAAKITLRERGFVPTELRLLFQTAGLRVEHLWGGTAGNWGRRPLDLDEIEIMVAAVKSSSPCS